MSVCVCVCKCKGGGGGGGADSAGRACDAGPWVLTPGCQVWGRCVGVWVMVWDRCLGSGSKLNTHLTHGFRATAFVGRCGAGGARRGWCRRTVLSILLRAPAVLSVLRVPLSVSIVGRYCVPAVNHITTKY